VALTGEGGGPLADLVDIDIRVPSSDSQRIQEAHIVIGHVICYLVERLLVDGRAKGVECLTGQTSG
jgi:D-sedoheptulose 7-phosphate isomerase